MNTSDDRELTADEYEELVRDIIRGLQNLEGIRPFASIEM
jgi:hypothetical protein